MKKLLFLISVFIIVSCHSNKQNQKEEIKNIFNNKLIYDALKDYQTKHPFKYKGQIYCISLFKDSTVKFTLDNNIYYNSVYKKEKNGEIKLSKVSVYGIFSNDEIKPTYFTGDSILIQKNIGIDKNNIYYLPLNKNSDITGRIGGRVIFLYKLQKNSLIFNDSMILE